MPKCLRCGKCCYYTVNGYTKKCRYLRDTKDGKTYCLIYPRRLGKIIDIMNGQIVVCGLRKNQNRFIEGCPLNVEQQKHHK